MKKKPTKPQQKEIGKFIQKELRKHPEMPVKQAAAIAYSKQEKKKK